MTNKEAIEFLKNMIDTQSVGAVLHNGEKALWQYHIEALNMAISALQPHWIPVTERLPEVPTGSKDYEWDGEDIAADEYIVMIRNAKHPTSLWWTGTEWIDVYAYESYCVLAWMPLPEPWKGEENEP